jgi:hypothetical protein
MRHACVAARVEGRLRNGSTRGGKRDSEESHERQHAAACHAVRYDVPEVVSPFPYELPDHRLHARRRPAAHHLLDAQARRHEELVCAMSGSAHIARDSNHPVLNRRTRSSW